MRTRDIDKEQLVKEKTIELIVNDGFEGFSVNKLAKACGISVATLYIYYKDKDDLILRVGIEEAQKMVNAMLKDFDPESGFEAGLRQQWKNRSKVMLDNPQMTLFFEQLRSSTYQEVIYKTFETSFKGPMGKFMKNAVKRGQIADMPLEVYWSVAFGPLYSMIRFHVEGKSISGRKFVMTDKLMWQAFDLVLKALKKN